MSRTFFINERDALLAIHHGIDVVDHEVAGTLQALRTRYPELFVLTPIMGDYGPTDLYPFFGAILSPAGAAEIGVEPDPLMGPRSSLSIVCPTCGARPFVWCSKSKAIHKRRIHANQVANDQVRQHPVDHALDVVAIDPVAEPAPPTPDAPFLA